MTSIKPIYTVWIGIQLPFRGWSQILECSAHSCGIWGITGSGELAASYETTFPQHVLEGPMNTWDRKTRKRKYGVTIVYPLQVRGRIPTLGRVRSPEMVQVESDRRNGIGPQNTWHDTIMSTLSQIDGPFIARVWKCSNEMLCGDMKRPINISTRMLRFSIWWNDPVKVGSVCTTFQSY